jgi:hypothetical protein
MIDLPDWGTPLWRIAGSVDKIAGIPPGDRISETQASADAATPRSANEDGAKTNPKVDTYRQHGN